MPPFPSTQLSQILDDVSHEHCFSCVLKNIPVKTKTTEISSRLLHTKDYSRKDGRREEEGKTSSLSPLQSINQTKYSEVATKRPLGNSQGYLNMLEVINFFLSHGHFKNRNCLWICFWKCTFKWAKPITTGEMQHLETNREKKKKTNNTVTTYLTISYCFIVVPICYQYIVERVLQAGISRLAEFYVIWKCSIHV